MIAPPTPPYRVSESCESRCWPVDTSSSPRGYRRAISPIMRATPVCIGGNSSVNRNVLGICPRLKLPEARVLQEDTDAGQPAQDGTVPPVEETELQEVHLEEAKWWPHDQISQPDSATAIRKILGCPGRVAIHLFQMVRQVPVGDVHQRRAEATHI